MKILILFIDMIRPNRLSFVNDNIKRISPFEKSIKKLGGTFYSNCFTEGPDTPRGLATFSTGIPPNKNGCNTRVKWPRYFLDKNLKTIYDLFLEKNYKISMFSNPNERNTGMFPNHITDMNIHNHDFDLKSYLNKIKLTKNHLLFVSLPDFHWSFDDNGYTTYGESKAYCDINKSFELVFQQYDKDDFDHIFIFSDHGFKFNYEIRSQRKIMLLDEDRTNILMIHRKKGESIFRQDNKLCGLSQVYHSIDHILNNRANKKALEISKPKNYIAIEDHYNFYPTTNQNIELWSVVKNDAIYIRTLDSGYILNRDNRIIKIEVNNEYDEILKHETSFKKYFEEHKKIKVYNNLILKQTNFMYGRKRKKQFKLLKLVFSFIDILLFKIKKQ
tara:strand:+ start:27043 stop:28203 length:1161 start_codon:yes stop_codon:yes gene_type:complete